MRLGRRAHIQGTRDPESRRELKEVKMANQNNNNGGQQQDVNQLLKVRREKLQNLQEAGKDPSRLQSTMSLITAAM